MYIFKLFGIFGKFKRKYIKPHYCKVSLLVLAEILKSYPLRKSVKWIASQYVL